jgi:sensor domain CHASE-containing protein
MDLLNILQHYWSIIFFIGVAIISWVRYEYKNNAQDRDISDLKNRLQYTESKLESHIASQTLLLMDMATIKATLEYIKQAIEELKELRKK